MKNLSLLFLLQFIFILCIAQNDIPERPSPARLVNDAASMLSPEESAALEQKLKIYSDTTSTQIAIVIVPSIGDYDVVDYTQRLGQKWGVGQKEKNNGIVILVAAKEHKTAIVTGYGMEGSIPDSYTKRIQDQILKPRFKQGNFYQGLDEATDAIIQMAAGEYKGDPKDKSGSKIPTFLIILVILVLLSLFRKNRNPRHSTFSSRGMFLGGGGFGGFGGGGGSGGGGFGGFGGGSFGGGGSGGDW